MSRIYDFRQDEHGRWEALLECGHVMPVRHRPPYINRPWVLTEEGRRGELGRRMVCKACRDRGEAAAA